MINWKAVRLEDKEIIDSYYKEYNSEISDYSFTQLLLWADAYSIEYAILEGFLTVKLRAPGETVPYIHMPVGTGNLGEALSMIKADFEENAYILTIRSITKSQFQEIKSVTNDHVRFKLLRNQYEYIYPSNDLSKLDTKKLKRKLDMYRRFVRHNTFSIVEMNDDDGQNIGEILESWYDNLPSSEMLESERIGIERVLKNWSALDSIGCVLKVNDEPIAFSIGEPLTDNMFLVLVEKAIKDYKDAYVAVIKEFAEMYSGDYKFTNREEDLGIPGLRKAKLLYRPCRFIEKGVAYFTMNGAGKGRVQK